MKNGVRVGAAAFVLSPGVTRITATYAWDIEGDQRRRVEAFMDVTVT